ncbi:MAG: acyltransferase [Deltaproteobacteria bacterium]|jgi:peptidoglycan/LPS O-acetylase OafA/YrhL|nr:acyltransferase [Deltaproteobacteria bacterium]
MIYSLNGQSPLRQTSNAAGRASISQIHTLRVLAMLGVFLHHLWNTVILTPVGSLQWGLDVIFDTASDGVILFNVLSGFLLALPYLGPERRTFIGYGNFLHRRFLRIIPPYYLALLPFSLANILIFHVPLDSALRTLLLHLGFLNSFDYSMMASNFSHFWYLGMLAQFYLLFPFFLRFFERVGSNKAIVWIVAMCWIGWAGLNAYLSLHPESSLGMVEYLMHFNLPGRLPEFAAGMWLASRWTSSAPALRTAIFDRPFTLVFLAMLAGIVLGTPFLGRLGMPWTHMYHVSLCMVLVVPLILWTPVAALGKKGFIQKLSVYSYAIYIVHEPLFSYVGVMPNKVPHTLSIFLVLALLLLALSYLAATALDRVSGEMLKKYTDWKKYVQAGVHILKIPLKISRGSSAPEKVLAAKPACDRCKK